MVELIETGGERGQHRLDEGVGVEHGLGTAIAVDQRTSSRRDQTSDPAGHVVNGVDERRCWSLAEHRLELPGDLLYGESFHGDER